MTAVSRPTTRAPARHAWLPRQHGAWAMLALPFLLGIAASRPSPWQLMLAGVALAGYLGSAALQAWSRSRRMVDFRAPMTVYGSLVVVLGVPLVASFPALLLSLVVLVPAGVVVLRGARPGSRRDLAMSLAQVAQALVLVPACALVSGELVASTVATYTLIAAGYLVGTVLVVRSVLRERGNERFAGVSIAFHVGLVAAAAIALPWAYVLVAVLLTIRAAVLPVAQRRLAGTPRSLRPIQVGMVELAASMALVAVSFAVPA